MSTNPTSFELNGSECEKGQVTQRPPIQDAASKAGLLMMTTQETIKMKLPEGEHKQPLLVNRADADEYVKHLMTFDRLLDKKGCGADLADAAKAVLKVGMTLKKHLEAPKGENDPAKAKRLAKVKAAEKELTAAKVVESTVLCLTYDLFRKLTKDEDPEIQWDRIVVDMYSKNPWMDIKGVKYQYSAKNCINL